MLLNSTTVFILVNATTHDAAHSQLCQHLKQVGFVDLQTVNTQSICVHLSDKSLKTELILFIDVRERPANFDFSGLQYCAPSPSIFLEYTPQTHKRCVVLDHKNRPRKLSSEECQEWADAYSFAGAALVPRDIILNFFKQGHGTFEALFEAAVEKVPDMLGLPLPPRQASPKRPCLFLDRDGIVVEDPGYVSRTEDLHIIPDIAPLIRWAKSQQWFVVIVSNQSGVARGKFPASFLEECSKYLDQELSKMGATPDAWFYCPYYEKGSIPEYMLKSVSRKPQAGLLLQASTRFPIALEQSFMIGDKVSDQIPLLGLQSLTVQGAYPLDGADKIFADLGEALSYLKSHVNDRSKPGRDLP